MSKNTSQNTQAISCTHLSSKNKARSRRKCALATRLLKNKANAE
jgi:hypothetical protein